VSGPEPRVLYIVYWGAIEPLGQSLVVPSVIRLAALGARLTLVTFEKPADLDNESQIDSIRAKLADAGIEWHPLKYHKSPKVPATLFDVICAVWCALRLRLKHRFDVLHARTFIGGLMGLAAARLIGAKLIYHNEGFYPDEQVDGGVWREGSAPHKTALSLERQMYMGADAVIAMSHRGRRAIEALPGFATRQVPVEVVPSCVDLTLFRRSAEKNPGTLRLVYSGTVGGRYILDRVGRFVAIARETLGDVELQVLTRADAGLVQRMLREGGLADCTWTMEAVPYAAMPLRLSHADAGLFFLSQGLSEHGCSPTKVGEYWAMGLPVVTTPNVSDIDDIIERERVGVIVRGHNDEDYRNAALNLADLLKEGDLATRCRLAAEKHYSLEDACQRQFRLYDQMTGRDEKGRVERSSQETA
jgi:glycosyltransferase involved in cell wall biosynthesis